ncbi:hypothetical protein GH714_011392 [Hevea brasiliensis]|uniref:SANTA domain-containing protein n=1 Tax=Hevea brasiliensis TaxID=3981 RepID=A0A6A6KMR2_HEVBR|nr:hypothetical protein GH714_011392 [Hevea brasiliensis]
MLSSTLYLLTLSFLFEIKVSLCDWWLIKADKDFQGKRLAVAGVTSREQQVLRVFHSAPITKRYDVFTLETADGIIVVFQGFINKTRTIENGFPSEVFSHFLFGFPPYWEEYAENCFKQAVSSDFDFQNASDFDESTDQGCSEDFRPIPSPYKNKDTSENELNIKDLEAVLECVDEGEVICEESLLRSPTAGDFGILKQPSNNFQETMLSTMKTFAKVNDVTPSMIESIPMNTIPSNSGSQKCSRPLGDLKENKKQKPMSGCSMNHKNKELISEVDEL